MRIDSRLHALRYLLALALGLSASVSLPGQFEEGTPRSGLAAFRQALLDASNDARVVVVATHPDDPYRALCMLLRRRWGCDVTVLLATRGEGGQNAVGPEQGQDLARIRTQETVRAASALDVDLSFLDFPDFGYSRSASEALRIWRGERAYARMSTRIRELDPDLVITIHRPDETHGQKRAVLDLLERMASDVELPAFRVFRCVAQNGREDPTVVLDYEVADLTTGRSFRRESYRILGFHRTQAPRRPFSDPALPRRHALRGFGRVRSTSLFADLPTLWEHSEKLDEQLREAGAALRATQLRRVLDGLPQGQRGALGARTPEPTLRALDALAALNAVTAQGGLSADLAKRVSRRVDALERAIKIGSLLSLDWVDAAWLSHPGPVHVRDGRVPVEVGIRNGGPFEVVVDSLEVAPGSGGRFRLANKVGRIRLAAGRRSKTKLSLVLDDDASLSGDGADVVLLARVRIRSSRNAKPVRVTATLARRVLPPAVVTLRPVPESRFLVPENGGRVRLSLEVRKPAGLRLRATLAMAGPPGVRFLPESERDDLPIRISLDEGARRLRVPIQIVVPAWIKVPARPRELRFDLRGASCDDAWCMVRIEAVKIRLPADLKIGLVRGPDTTIEESLASLGLDVRELEPRSLARAELDDYDTILIDSRALLRRRDDLVPQIPRFLDYARRGKHLVVLYHKPQEFEKNELGALLAPYPLELGPARVTREDGPVTMLLPDHAHLSWPNRIQQRDWDGWVQERGLYFPARYGSDYAELLSIRELRDEGDDSSSLDPSVFEPKVSSLLAARVGRGSYVYCALVLHRQLRNLHPGAARLLVNLVTPPGWARLR